MISYSFIGLYVFIGTTAEEFTKKNNQQVSMVEKLAYLISQINSVGLEKVVFLNVINCIEQKNTIDVFYTIFIPNPPSSTTLNSILALHSDQVI